MSTNTLLASSTANILALVWAITSGGPTWFTVGLIVTLIPQSVALTLAIRDRLHAPSA